MMNVYKIFFIGENIQIVHDEIVICDENKILAIIFTKYIAIFTKL